MTTADYTRSQGPYLSTPTKTLRNYAGMNNEGARAALESRIAFTHQLHGTPVAELQTAKNRLGKIRK